MATIKVTDTVEVGGARDVPTLQWYTTQFILQREADELVCELTISQNPARHDDSVRTRSTDLIDAFVRAYLLVISRQTWG